MKDAKDYEKIRELIAKIQEACGNDDAVFRGEYRDYGETAVSSGLYREHKDEDIFKDHYQPGDVEKENVDKARREAFPAGTLTVDILTDLRHFGADTAVVDFSKDLLVALFFACNGEPKDNEESPSGFVWVLPVKDIKELDPDRIHDKNRTEMGFITPGQTSWSRSRVENQSSIFVHTRRGIVDKKYMKKIEIPHELKQDCLAYLEKFHDISHGTIYNDLIGFIQNERNLKKTRFNLYKGSSEVAIKHYEDAIKDYDEAIRLRPNYPEAFYYRGNCKTHLEDRYGAIKDYDEAIRLRPNYPEAFYYRGNTKTHLEDRYGAIKDYDEAIRLRPNYPEAFYYRGNTKTHLEDRYGAIKDYDEAIRLRPDYPEAFNSRGIAKGKLGKYEDAIKDFDEAIRLRPDDPAAFNNRGNCKGNLGDHDGAIKDYDEAIRLRPDYPEAFYYRGNCKGNLGDHDGAIKDYDEANRLRSDDPKP